MGVRGVIFAVSAQLVSCGRRKVKMSIVRLCPEAGRLRSHETQLCLTSSKLNSLE